MTQEALKLALEALERSVATCFDQYAHRQVMSQPDHFINQAITAIKEALAQEQECWCTTCRPITMADMRFVVCPDCDNKRCPKANDHRNACTNSNEVGQKGSSWEHVKPLAQPELCKYGQEPASCTSNPMDCQCAIDAALAQQEQDHIPDARKMVTEQEPVAHCEAGPEYCPVCNTELNQEPAIYPEEAYEMGLEEIAFYTAPPRRTWVGLTDDEIIDVLHPLVMADMSDEATDYEIARAIEAKLKEKNT